MSRPIWEIEKDTMHGTSFRLIVGTPGIPGTREVGGLSREQAERLGRALAVLEDRATKRALKGVREALGITRD